MLIYYNIHNMLANLIFLQWGRTKKIAQVTEENINSLLPNNGGGGWVLFRLGF